MQLQACAHVISEASSLKACAHAGGLETRWLEHLGPPGHPSVPVWSPSIMQVEEELAVLSQLWAPRRYAQARKKLSSVVPSATVY